MIKMNKLLYDEKLTINKKPRRYARTGLNSPKLSKRYVARLAEVSPEVKKHIKVLN